MFTQTPLHLKTWMRWQEKSSCLLRRVAVSLTVSRKCNARIRTIKVIIRMNRVGLAISQKLSVRFVGNHIYFINARIIPTGRESQGQR